jgi:cell division GTPase FtsZ
MQEKQDNAFSFLAAQAPVAKVPEKNVVKDIVPVVTAWRPTVIGIGRAGNNFANAFWKMGYRHILAINSTAQDMDGLVIDENNLIDMNQGGFCKDYEKSRRYFQETTIKAQLREFMSQVVDDSTEEILVAWGLGGGTGGGGSSTIVEIAKQLADELKNPCRVGAIVSIPSNEGSTSSERALYGIEEAVLSLNISPLILVDNSKRRHPAKDPYGQSNDEIVQLYSAFLCFAAMTKSLGHNVDKSELAAIFDSGIITFGRSTVDWHNGVQAVSQAVFDTFKNNSLVDVDLSTAKHAACIVYAGENVLSEFDVEDLLIGVTRLDQVSNKLIIHPGLYEDVVNPDSLQIYTLAGGLTLSKDMIKALASRAHISTASALQKLENLMS